ncbi:TPA: MFS transporter [Serratia fonticola]
MTRPGHLRGMVVLTGLQFVISVADWMLIVLLQIVVFDLTRSAFDIMLLVICELISMLLFGAWAGAIADRTSLKRVLIWACVARLLIIMGLLWPSVRGQLGAIFAIAVLGAICSRFIAPAASAVLPSLVTADRLPAANAIIMAARMSGMAAGTLFAGLVASHYGHMAAIAMIGALLFMASVLCILLPNTRSRPEPVDRAGIWHDLYLAISRYGSNLMLPVLVSMLVMLALGSFEIIALIYVVQVLERPPADVGLLFGAYGVGMLVGLALSAWQGINRRYGMVMIICLCLMCVAIWGLSQVHTLGLALPLVTVAGSSEGLVITLSLLCLYQQVSGDFYARMIALLDTATGGAFLLSVMLTGMVADRIAAGTLIEGLAITLSGLLVAGIVASNLRLGERH